jgi:hypothetical protein
VGTPSIRWPSIILAAVCFVVFLRTVSYYQLGAQAGFGLSSLSGREAMFWLFHSVFVIPAALLVAHGLQGPLSTRLGLQPIVLTRRTWISIAAAYGTLVFGLARILRTAVLLDLPVTDDEYSVIFGAKILAAGHVSVPSPALLDAFPILYTHVLDGRLSAGDFPGGQVFMALALLTRADSTLHALWAALTAVGVVVACHRLSGRQGVLLGAAFWLVSPSVLWLSSTTHSHVVSRGFIALAFAVYAGLATLQPESWRSRSLALFGLASATAFFCRPAEAALLLSPAAAHIVVRAWPVVLARARVALMLCAALLPLAAFAAYNTATTGVWYLPARFSPGAVSFVAMTGTSWWDLLATNLGFNLLMLAVFFLGPLGLVLLAAGMRAGGATARVLSIGVALHLGFALLHNNTGIHSVGPIHYSDTIVPLTLIAVVGARALLERLEQSPVAKRRAIVGLAAYLFLALPVFNVVQGGSLLEQARNQAAPLDALASARLTNAIVVAPQFAAYWRYHPGRARWGSWIFEFPPPDPFLRDEVLVLSREVTLEQLREHYPGRAVYRMEFPRGDSETFTFVPITPAEGRGE